MNFETAVIIITLSALLVVSQAIPLIDLNNALQQSVLQNIVTPACSPNGKCWEWFPTQEVDETVPIMADDIPILKSQVRRQTNIDPNTIIESWDDNGLTEEKKTHPSSHTMRQFGNRLSKKDVFMSRGLGVGGMPFSVLYMSPHGSRANHASATPPQEVGKTTESSTPPLTHPNYRIALRNGASTQPRRRFPIIPQLFIWYELGPFGK